MPHFPKKIQIFAYFIRALVARTCLPIASHRGTSVTVLLHYTVGQLWVSKVRVDAVLPCCSAYATVFNVPAASLGPTAAVAGHDAGSTGLYWPCSGAEFPVPEKCGENCAHELSEFLFCCLQLTCKIKARQTTYCSDLTAVSRRYFAACPLYEREEVRLGIVRARHFSRLTAQPA